MQLLIHERLLFNVALLNCQPWTQMIMYLLNTLIDIFPYRINAVGHRDKKAQAKQLHGKTIYPSVSRV